MPENPALPNWQIWPLMRRLATLDAKYARRTSAQLEASPMTAQDNGIKPATKPLSPPPNTKAGGEEPNHKYAEPEGPVAPALGINLIRDVDTTPMSTCWPRMPADEAPFKYNVTPGLTNSQKESMSAKDREQAQYEAQTNSPSPRPRATADSVEHPIVQDARPVVDSLPCQCSVCRRNVSSNPPGVTTNSILSSAASIVSFDSTFSDTYSTFSQMSPTPVLNSADLGAKHTSLPELSEIAKTPIGGHATTDDSFRRHDVYFFEDGNITFLVRSIF